MRPLSARWRSISLLTCLLMLGAYAAMASASGDRREQDALVLFNLDLGKLHQLSERLNRFGEDFPAPSLLAMERIAAYEEHELFAYAVARSGPAVRPWDVPQNEWRVLCIKPDLLLCVRFYLDDAGDGYLVMAPSPDSKLVIDREAREVLSTSSSLTVRARLLWPVHARTHAMDRSAAGNRPAAIVEPEHRSDSVRTDVWLIQTSEGNSVVQSPQATVRTSGGTLIVAIRHDGGSFQFEVPMDGADPGEIILGSQDGGNQERRPLPAGILPHGKEGAAMIERWNRAYAPGNVPPWDTGRPDSHLREAIASGTLTPCSTIEFGCGTGTNAIFLARQGFNVIGLDVAPRAIAIARQKAKEAGVQVRFYLADVLNLPEGLPQVDLVFDRGCYHGVRRFAADRYVRSLTRVTRPGSLVFILAGNANEERHYGPPRVTETQLVTDFAKDFAFLSLKAVRFDTHEQDRAGALGWAVLLRRR